MTRTHPDKVDPASQSTASLSALRSGAPEALERCFREYAPSLVLLAQRLTGERADAEDVVQDVFVGLPDALRRYEDRGAFGAWLRRLTTRHALTRMRHTRSRREDSLSLMTLNLSTPVAAMQGAAAHVERALLALPDTQRQVFVLRVIEGHAHAQIAQLLGISVGASEVRLSRAVKSLRTLLGGTR